MNVTFCVRRILFRKFQHDHRRLLSSRKLSNEEVRKKRNELFNKEYERQMVLLGRLEKIKVEYTGLPEQDSCSMVMNKGVSTPFHCAMHVGELHMNRSVVAMVNGAMWDMHRPLVDDCKLEFLHFREEDPRPVNDAFWRSCSFLLGHVLETAFKDETYVELCSFPPPNVKSGSFVYDADIKLPNWKPTAAEFNCLSRIVMKMSSASLKFESLDIDASRALDMFEDNHFKREQIPMMADKTSNKVRVYRAGDHVDISRGPLISNTSFIGRYTVTAIHDVETKDWGNLQRVQGLAMPKQLMMHYWTYEFLSKRASKLNPAPLPTINSPQNERKQLEVGGS